MIPSDVDVDLNQGYDDPILSASKAICAVGGT